MRVLMIANGYPPQAAGGTELSVQGLARALHERFGDTVSVLAREADTRQPEHQLRRSELEGIPVWFLNNTYRRCRSFEHSYRDPAVTAAAAPVWQEADPQVVHVHHLSGLSSELVHEAVLRDLPVVMTLHDLWLLCHRGQLLDHELQACPGPGPGCARCAGAAAVAGSSGFAVARLLREARRHLPAGLINPVHALAGGIAGRLSRRSRGEEAMQHRTRDLLATMLLCNQLLVPSRAIANAYQRAHPELVGRLEPWQLGIDRRRFAGLERSRSARLRIGYLGSLIPSKAPHLLLEAFARLPAGTATLALYGDHAAYHGDTSYRRRLEPLLALPGVVHHGAIPHQQVPQAMADLDVVVVPSVWIETSLVVREAFAAGTPVIVSDLGGMAEIVQEGRGGLRFPPGDVPALQRALTRLVDDRELQPRLAATIPAVRELHEEAAQLREVYRRLTGKHRHRSPDRPRLAAVVLSYRSARDTVLAVRSLQSDRAPRPPDQIIVVDNGSDDGSLATLQRHLHGIELLATGSNLGFSGGCNTGIRAALAAGAELVLLLNPDAMVNSHTLATLECGLRAYPQAGIAGPVILHRGDPTLISSAGISFSVTTGRVRHRHHDAAWDPHHPPRTTRVAAVSGCAMLIHRRVLDTVGLLDEDYFFAFEEIDLCLRAARHGLYTLLIGNAVAYHQGSVSIGSSSPQRLYYAARNHLLAAQRASPAGGIRRLTRPPLIVAYNLAHALLTAGGSRPANLRAVLRGIRDWARRRYGPYPY